MSKEEERKETGRVEAFSDGVFAIAITLLAFQIKLPSPSSPEPLTAQLRAAWPSYLSFFISFAYIGIVWINHHRLFTRIRRSDHMLLVLNIVLLMGVTLVPGVTVILASYLEHPGRKIATLVYCGTYFVVSVAFNLLWRYAAVNYRLSGKGLTPGDIRRISWLYAVGPSMYLLCFLLALVSVPASLALNFALAIYFALPPHWRPIMAFPELTPR